MLAQSSHLRPVPSPSTPTPLSCSRSVLFVRAVAERCDCPDEERLAATVMTTLRALARRLRPIDARVVARQLPPALASAFISCGSGDNGAPVHAFDEALAAGLPPRHVRAVCQVLTESIDEQARAQLRMQPLCTLAA